jgi:hypothetical protein
MPEQSERANIPHLRRRIGLFACNLTAREPPITSGAQGIREIDRNLL